MIVALLIIADVLLAALVALAFFRQTPVITLPAPPDPPDYRPHFEALQQAQHNLAAALTAHVARGADPVPGGIASPPPGLVEIRKNGAHWSHTTEGSHDYLEALNTPGLTLHWPDGRIKEGIQ